MDSWQSFNEALPSKKLFYSNLRIEDTTYEDYKHAKKVQKDFELKNLGDYHDLYVQSDTLLHPKTFETNELKHELDPAHFLLAPGLAWQACLKKTEKELELLTNINMLKMVEKGIGQNVSCNSSTCKGK